MEVCISEVKTARETLIKEAEDASRRYMEALKVFMKEGDEMLQRFNEAIIAANSRFEMTEQVRMSQWRGELNPEVQKKPDSNPPKIKLPVIDEDEMTKAMAEKLAPINMATGSIG